MDEQTYQEIFGLCQALPGPASTKLLFCFTLLHHGPLAAILVLILWSLPGAVAMYAFSLGVQRLAGILPLPVYGLLSGLNAATVGIISLAGTQLANKAITSQWTRALVIFGACAGMCYNTLWYFPMLLVIGGVATTAWNGGLAAFVTKAKNALNGTRRRPAASAVQQPIDAQSGQQQDIELERIPTNTRAAGDSSSAAAEPVRRRNVPDAPSSKEDITVSAVAEAVQPDLVISSRPHTNVSMKVGLALVVLFIGSLIAVLVPRSTIPSHSPVLDLFANMYLAGTIIFGGGPVVIPLLRSYVVDPGWVSARDFLLGIAIIQALPGPNFNFAVYLGALAFQSFGLPTTLGALVGFVGIFTPGIVLAVSTLSIWQVLRKRRWIVSFLKGINATAVGLVFTAVYRLWEIGYLTPQATAGQSLAIDPWWVVVAALTYSQSAWFGISPAIAIIVGAVLGLCWYGAVGRTLQV
ncbi:chromate ion transporter [Dacryopinax primogenitus]|uniref:Chromate ion transporter n=1 Tax=Dacryopinax primogenitus (strain DJM 731) TaxID=1858805 RepID=M5FQZ2_DACPD|nr:chromate ion transporter [Dacryopinax primogenitus]EJT98023.1 chromate ion transporter [Dacryopinax primogenitus]